MATAGRLSLVALALGLGLLVSACAAPAAPAPSPPLAVPTPTASSPPVPAPSATAPSAPTATARPSPPATSIAAATPSPAVKPSTPGTPGPTIPTTGTVTRPGIPTVPPGVTFPPTPVPPTPYAGASVRPGDPFALAIGQAVAIEGGDLRLQVKAIAEDSRCPRSVNCVWSGRAVVALAATAAGGTAADLTVATCCAGPEGDRARHAGHEVRLLRVLPYPLRHDTPIQPAEYLVELSVTRPAG